MISDINHVDLAFVVDTTASMGPFIDLARAHMIRTLKMLQDDIDIPLDLREGLVELTHRIAGSGGSYGYPDLSAAARTLELMLKELDGPPADGAALEQAYRDLVAALEAVAQAPVD